MSQYIIDYGDGRFQASVEQFGTLAEAQAWEAQVFAHTGEAGTLMDLATWVASARGEDVAFDQALNSKVEELRLELLKRVEIIASVEAITTVALTSSFASSSSITGRNVEKEFEAYSTALSDLAALPDAAAIQAYDVVNDPPWPTTPAGTTNLANVQSAEESSGLTTTLTAGVWAPLNCVLAQVGSADNFTVVGNTITYTGEVPLEVLARITISGERASGSSGRFRIGISLNDAPPALSMRGTSQRSPGADLTWGAEAVISLANGDELKPYIINPTSGRDFILEDVIITIGRWVT